MPRLKWGMAVEGHATAFPRHEMPEFCFSRAPSKREGAGKAGCSASTRSLARKQKKRTSVVATGSPKQSDLPCAMVYGLFRALPGDRAVLPPSLSRIAPQKLDASVGASGPHGFAVRLKHRSSYDTKASTASRLNVRDDREAPLLARRDGANVRLIWGPRQCERPATD